MSICKCEEPTTVRATSEDGGGDYLYLRCGECNGKIGTLKIDKKGLLETVTNPNEAGEFVSIRFDEHDSPWMFENEVRDE